MGIIRESLAKANAKKKKVENAKKEKTPIVFNNGDDSVEPVDENKVGSGAGAGSSVAQITGENFSKLMEAFIASEKFGRDGKIVHAVTDALADINEDNCNPESVIDALRAAGLDFIADAFVRVSNGDDIDTVVSETEVTLDDTEEDNGGEEKVAAAEVAAAEGAPAEEAPAEEAPEGESAEPAEKKKPGRPKNSDKK